MNFLVGRCHFPFRRYYTMTNRFLTTSAQGGMASSHAQASSLSATNLDIGRPVKTDNKRRLISSNLEISDINSLQAVLDTTIMTPYGGNFQASNFTTSSADLNANKVSISDLETNAFSVHLRLDGMDTDNSTRDTAIADIQTADITTLAQLNSTDANATFQQGRIDTVIADTSTNSTNLTANTAAISTLESSSSSVALRLDDMDTDNVTQSTAITDLQAAAVITTTDLTANTAAIATLESNSLNAASRLDGLDTTTTLHTSAIANLSSDTINAASRLDGLDTTTTLHTSAIANLSSDTAAAVIRLNLMDTADSFNATRLSTLETNTDNNASDIADIETTIGSSIPTLESKTQHQSVSVGGVTTFDDLDVTNYSEAGETGELMKVKNGTVVFAGPACAASLQNSTNSVFIGNFCATTLTNGSGNTAIGDESMTQIDSSHNTAIGSRAMTGVAGTTASQNTCIGYLSMRDINGNSAYNTAVGLGSARELDNSYGNTCIGHNTQGSYITGLSHAVSIGHNASCTGDEGIAIGFNSVAPARHAIIGNPNQEVLGTMGNGTCDLGTTSLPFKESFVKTGVDINSGAWKIGYNGDNLTVTNSDGYKTTIAHPEPVGSKSTILRHIDLTHMSTWDMTSNITAANGGTNRCWGSTALYNAGEPLLAGRVVGMANGGDSSAMRVEYLTRGTGVQSGTYPIGITLENQSTVGDPILICTSGICTAISMNAVGEPAGKGSLVLGPTATTDNGRVRVGVSAAAVEARVGVLCQKEAIVVNGPCLVHFLGYFQGT